MRNVFMVLVLTWLAVTLAVQKQVFSETQYNVNIPREVCDNLVDAVPLPDVNYQAGVDANGQSVTPADLSANPSLAMPNPIAIQMTGSSLALMGLSNKNLFLDPQVQMGWVTYYQDGRILFNGQPIGDSQQQALTELCKKHAADSAKGQPNAPNATVAPPPISGVPDALTAPQK